MTRKAGAAVLGLMLGISLATLMAPGAARAGVLYLNACAKFGDAGNGIDAYGLVWRGFSNGSFGLSNRCGQAGSFQVVTSTLGGPAKGKVGEWGTIAPPSIRIVRALTPVNEVYVDPSLKADGFSAAFVWDGGSQQIVSLKHCCWNLAYGSGINRSFQASRTFGWRVTCVKTGGCFPAGQVVDVHGIQLTAVDNTPPRLLALGSNNLWYQQSRWVRGVWPASFLASADSGVCSEGAVVGGQVLLGPQYPTRNRSSWMQCPSPVTMNLAVDTTRYPNGALPLTLAARDAASPANVAEPQETIQVDNQPVGLTLSGPRDAASTAGVQHIAAIGTAGESGVAGVVCAVDGSSYQWHPGSAAEIPVQGVGEHQVSCYAQNNAVDASGVPATSAVCPRSRFSPRI